MAKKQISQGDWQTIVLGMNALIEQLEAKNQNGNFEALIENALEIGEYFNEKVEKRERLGIGWGA